jgi:hypothetical protein
MVEALVGPGRVSSNETVSAEASPSSLDRWLTSRSYAGRLAPCATSLPRYAGRVSRENAELIEQAFAAYVRGDVDDAVSLLHPDVYWRGVERGHLWWKRAPE